MRGALDPARWRIWLETAFRSSWTLGLLAAVATWNVVFTAPFAGVDPSWVAGLYIAAHRGLQFGPQVIFTYGPLGFLAQPWIWYSGLSAIAFVYQAALHVLLCVSLVWALRRTFHPILAVVATFLVVVTMGSLDVAVVLSAVWCLAILAPDPPAFASPLVAVGGALLGVAQTLIYPRSGLIVLAICLVALLAGARRRRDVPVFLGVAIVALFALWLAAGQNAGNLPIFASRSFQIISGFSEAMGVQTMGTIYRFGAIIGSLALIGYATLTSVPGRTRLGAIILTAIASFVMFKEGNVRAEINHTAIFFATAGGMCAGLAFARRRWLAVGVLAVAIAVNVHLNSLARSDVSYNPLTYAQRASDQVRLLFNPVGRNFDAHFFSLIKMTQQYKLPPALVALVKGHTVQADPEEVAALWAYGLASEWVPGPVIQDYSAYTAGLDHLEAAELSSASAPERILRWSVPKGRASYPQTSIDGRLVAWDPPAKNLAMLCHYVPLATKDGWQVLSHAPNRCGVPRLVSSTRSSFGANIAVPSATMGSIVFARIYGAGVTGFEKLRTFFFRAHFRYAIVNGKRSYRLVPGTAEDGLVMNAAPGVDYPLPFSLAPGAHTIRLVGSSGPLRIKFYDMTVGR